MNREERSALSLYDTLKAVGKPLALIEIVFLVVADREGLVSPQRAQTITLALADLAAERLIKKVDNQPVTADSEFYVAV